MDNVKYSTISRSLMKSHLQCPFGPIKWQTHRSQRWGRGHLWPKGIILPIAEDRHDYLRVCVCLCVSLASFLMAAMTCPLLLSFLRFLFPTSPSSSSYRFYWGFRPPPTSTTSCTHFLARHPSGAKSVLVWFSSVLPIKCVSSPTSTWHVMEAQFMRGPLVGGKVPVITSGQRFVSNSRLSISLLLWDLPAHLFPLWYSDQQFWK